MKRTVVAIALSLILCLVVKTGSVRAADPNTQVTSTAGGYDAAVAPLPIGPPSGCICMTTGNSGSAPATLYSYAVTTITAGGESIASPEVSCINASVLDSTHKNSISCVDPANLVKNYAGYHLYGRIHGSMGYLSIHDGFPLVDNDSTVSPGAAAPATDSSGAFKASALGNVPVTKLNSGTAASSSTFWRGDGTWAAPAGGSNPPLTTVLVGASPYVVLPADQFISCDVSGGAITLTLPAVPDPVTTGIRTIVVQPDSAANYCTINRNAVPGTDTINGAASLKVIGANAKFYITNYAAGKWSVSQSPATINDGYMLAGGGATINSTVDGSGKLTLSNNFGAAAITASTTVKSTTGTGTAPAHLAVFGTCNAGTEGLDATEDNSTAACVAGAIATSGAAVHCKIYCNGTNWLQTGL